ncbi:MAG TPA: DUF1707 domain-containing protein [Longimicrobiaceae bacterium]|nr:DUF1707 domain-containing protein [Longimicrobiaceae bacterium]
MSDPIPQPVPLEQTRQRIVAQLIEHFAVENLDDRALEERLAKVYELTTPAELQALVADLPVVQAPASGTAMAAAPARTDYVPERQVVAALMGGAERKGVWTPPQELWVVAVMGGAELDFRQARFGPGVTEVNCFILMGGVEIVVPPGVHVELNGLAIMGGFGQTGSVAPDTERDAPVLRIGGFAMMGGVDVQVRYEHERPSDARRREKLQREERKRLQGGR